MVKWFIKPLRRWPTLEALLTRLANRFTTWPADDFERFAHGAEEGDLPGDFAALPPLRVARPPRPLSIAPETFERRFMHLHAEGRLYEMWDLLAEDARRAWGSREQFISRMPRFDPETQLLDISLVELAILDSWVDEAHRRAYRNVARLTMRYRVRHSGSESTFERQVHLIPAAAGWRTLCYPSSQDLAVGSAVGR